VPDPSPPEEVAGGGAEVTTGVELAVTSNPVLARYPGAVAQIVWPPAELSEGTVTVSDPCSSAVLPSTAPPGESQWMSTGPTAKSTDTVTE
jgi:hypothetical protein